MGLDKLFSSRPVVHAGFDPPLTTINETKRELVSFAPTWPCDPDRTGCGLMCFRVFRVLSVAALAITLLITVINQICKCLQITVKINRNHTNPKKSTRQHTAALLLVFALVY